MWVNKNTSRAVFALFVIFLITSPVYAGNLSPGMDDVSATKKAGNISPGVSDTETTLSSYPTPTPTYAPPNRGGGSGGGGSAGGSGVVTNEPWSNINRSDRQEKDMRFDRITAYNFDSDVYEVDIIGSENEYRVTVRVEELNGRSMNVPRDPQDEVYKYLNIYAGTKRIREVVVKFKVPVSWAPSKDVRLEWWSGSEWEDLESSKTSEDDNYAYYQAVGTHLSNFAIVGNTATAIVPDVAITATATPGGFVTVSATETPVVPSGSASSVQWVIILLVFIAVVALVMYIYIKW